MSSTAPQPPVTPAPVIDLKDPRVDRAISWALTTFAGLAFGVGAYFFAGLTSEVRAMRADMSTITTRVAIVEAARYGDTIKDLELRVRALEAARRNP